MFTWGDIQAIRWTVGDGTRPTRGNERWEHFDEFISLNLLEFEPEGFTAFSSIFPVSLQGLYNRADSRVLMASGAEAMLIRAEAAVRSGQTATAEQLLNDLRSDYSLRATIQWGVDPPDSADELTDLTLAGTLAQDLRTVAAERARELWLTGDRLTTSRRLRLDPTVNIDLFPPVKTRISGGDDIAFPIVQLELDNNPNLSSGDACPAGQTIRRQPNFFQPRHRGLRLRLLKEREGLRHPVVRHQRGAFRKHSREDAPTIELGQPDPRKPTVELPQGDPLVKLVQNLLEGRVLKSFLQEVHRRIRLHPCLMQGGVHRTRQGRVVHLGFVVGRPRAASQRSPTESSRR